MGPIAPAAHRLTGIGCWLADPGPRRSGEDLLARAVAVAVAAERAGATSLWVVEPSAGPPGAVPYEAYSLLGALAVRTGAIHLGVVADRGQRRPPSILAKIVTGVDVLAHGRAVLSLDGDRSSRRRRRSTR